MMLRIALSLLVTAVVGLGATAQPASDWPCIQRKVPEIALAAAWQGPEFDPASLSEVRKDAAVRALVDLLSQRRTTGEEARTAIAEFATAAGEAKRDKLRAVVASLFERVNAVRADIIAGIERYGRKQKQLAERVREENAKLDALRADPKADAAKVTEASDQVAWDLRIFDERQRSLRYVCEVPQLIEQRLFSLSRLLQAALAKGS